MSQRSSRIRNVFEPIPPSSVADLWHSRFAVPESAFSGYLFFRKAKSIWAISDAALPRLSYESLGMRIMNCKDRPWKPTTAALQIFGRGASKNTINLDSNFARTFLEGKTQDVDEAAVFSCEPGYVVVFYRGDVLGCGLYSHEKLVSQIPKERRMAGGEGEELS